MNYRRAGLLCLFWVGLAAILNIWIYYHLGSKPASEFLAGYLIEQSLSVDNLFVFLMIFATFKLPAHLEQKVLFWGILGAILLRGLFIYFGLALVNRFEWLFLVFGIFLVIMGANILFEKMRNLKKEIRNEEAFILRTVKKIIPMTDHYDGSRFFSHASGRWLATPLFAVLLVIEATDLIFAVDSIPAVFSVTRNPFIVFSSNIAAILGLRSFFFLLSGMMRYFIYLSHGVGLILMFIGVKMLAHSHFEITIFVTLLVIVGILAISVAMSLIFGRKKIKI